VSLDVLIAWLDAVRRRDAGALRGMLAPDATWQGVRPEWRCATPDEVVAMWLERAAALDDVESVELRKEGVLRLRAPSLGALDPRLRSGVDIGFELAADGRIARMQDAPVDSGPAWFVVNLGDAAWKDGPFGTWTPFEGEQRFAQVGVNVAVLEPGQPACFYHREADQEGFLVLRGEALLLVEGEERPLRTWDFFHCPPWTDHVLLGAGDAPCTVLAFGARSGGGVVYPASELAQRHGAGVTTETDKPSEAYADVEPDQPVAFDPRWLT
jgi:uncharacterized cupin superfamily protein